MKMDEILQLIKTLGCSQGFYSRLYNTLMRLSRNDVDTYNGIVETLEAEHFNDALDVIFYFES